MRDIRTTSTRFGAGVASLVLGLIGLCLCWWTPAGMVLSLAGLVVGLVGLAMSGRDSWPLPAAGMIFSAAALAVCWIIAARGMEWIRFGR